jgi:hypothetical protein
MDASHTDVNTAYAAVNRIRCDDMHPHIYRTRDGGKTWKEIVNGLPLDPINVVKEDPIRKGLLFAGSERAVYVSFDDGEHWQSLRLNMPATSIRDLVIKDDDLVIGTHGRSFWILDDITPLRQLSTQLANQPSILYQPQSAYRVRWNMYTDTPVPQEEAAGENPPDGAVIDYYLPEKAKKIELIIGKLNSSALDLEAGRIGYTIIRRFSNEDTLYTIGNVNIPHYWIRQQKILSAEPGHHRFTWDMKYAPLNIPPTYPISATYMNTEPDQTAPWIMPGKYIAELVVDGKAEREIFTIKIDPRIKTSQNDLQNQHNLSVQCYDGRKKCMKILEEIRLYRLMLRGEITNPPPPVGSDLDNRNNQAALLENNPPGSNAPSFRRCNNSFAAIFNTLQDSDRPLTTQAIVALAETQKQLQELKTKWTALKK